MRALLAVTLLSLAPLAAAQEKSAHPGYSPVLMQASAKQEGDRVIVQIARPGPKPPPTDRRQPFVLELEWVNLRKVTLGETVQAFGVDGKPLDAKAVLKALAEPTGVAVFLRTYTTDPTTPAAYYRAMLREGTVLLMVRGEDLYYPKP